jgi:hypothetical protein
VVSGFSQFSRWTSGPLTLRLANLGYRPGSAVRLRGAREPITLGLGISMVLQEGSVLVRWSHQCGHAQASRCGSFTKWARAVDVDLVPRTCALEKQVLWVGWAEDGGDAGWSVWADVSAGAADTRWERREGVAQDEGVECLRIHEYDIWPLSFPVTAGGGFEAMARGPSGHGAQNELRRERMVEQHVIKYERPKVVTLWRGITLEELNSEQAYVT